MALVSTPQLNLLGSIIGGLSDAPLYAELAEEESVTLVPGVFSKVLSDSRLKADSIHPNAEGYQVMAEGIAAELVKRGFLARR